MELHEVLLFSSVYDLEVAPCFFDGVSQISFLNIYLLYILSRIGCVCRRWVHDDLSLFPMEDDAGLVVGDGLTLVKRW